jgi:predicted protein tyrosine phosphatase
MRSQYYTDKNWYNDPKKYFISIAGIADGCEYPCPFLTKDSKRVLHLLFDDVTESYIDDPSIRIFDNEHAKKIVEFAKRIPTDAVLYVNCAAGISRSGAVGSCLNDYFNNGNVEDFNNFKEVNPQIQPNPYVKRILNKELYGEIDYFKIFSK